MANPAPLRTSSNETLLKQLAWSRARIDRGVLQVLDPLRGFDADSQEVSALANESARTPAQTRTNSPMNGHALAIAFLLGASASLLAGPLARGAALAFVAVAIRPGFARIPEQHSYIGAAARTAARPIAINLIRLTTRLLVGAILRRTKVVRTQRADS